MLVAPIGTPFRRWSKDFVVSTELAVVVCWNQKVLSWDTPPSFEPTLTPAALDAIYTFVLILHFQFIASMLAQ